MLCQFVQHIGGRRNGIRTEVKAQSGFLCSCYKAIGRCLVTVYVHVFSRAFRFARLYVVSVFYRSVHVATEIISGFQHLHIGFGYGRFACKLLTQQRFGHFQVTVKKPAHQSEGEHVAALEHRLVVHAAVGQAVLHHCGNRYAYHLVFNAEFGKSVVGGVFGLLKVAFLERIRIDYYSPSVTTPALHAPTVFSSFLLIVSIGLFLFISGKGIALYR